MTEPTSPTPAHDDLDASAAPAAALGPDELEEMDNIQGQLVLHFAGNDEYCPPEAQAKIRAAAEGRANVAIYDYPGVQHAFSRPRGDHYDAAADALARERTLKALRDALC